MKLRLETFDVSEDERRAIGHGLGKPGMASRREIAERAEDVVRAWLRGAVEAYAESLHDQLSLSTDGDPPVVV